MQGIQQLIAIGRQGAQGVSQIGAGLLQRALDRVYGPPQLARKVWTARRRWTRSGDNTPSRIEPEVTPEAIAVPEPATATALPAGAAQPALAVAERIRTARLIGPHNILYGLMWLYIYPAQGIARRVLKVTDRPLAKALGRQYYNFGDVPFDPVAGCRPLFDAMHAECRKVLNGRGGAMRVKQIRTRSDSHRPPTANAGLRKALAAQPAGEVRAIALPAAAPGASMPPVHGEAYQGVVMSAGRTNRTGPDGASYNTFCLTLKDGAREIPLFGTELERLSVEQRIGPGDRVRIVFMGKAMTQVPGRDRPAFRNLYQLEKVEEQS
jgi:hypothetical protein